MSSKSLKKINKEVVSQFPEMKNARPEVKPSGSDAQRFALTYKSEAKLPGGKTMKRVVRVIADNQGNILRISTSK